MSRRRDPESEEEDEEGYYDDEDDGFVVHTDEEEDEDEEYSNSKSKKKKKTNRNIFIDDTAIDSEGDEDYDEEEEEGEEGFIDYNNEITTTPSRPQYNRRPQLEEEESAEEIAARLNKKYSNINEEFMSESAPTQGGLIPTMSDPNLWMIKCKVGKEKHILKILIERVFRSKSTADPILVDSAFYRENLKGYLYVEAQKLMHVKKAIDKMADLFSSQVTLVPRKEMIDVLDIKHKDLGAKEKGWARLKRGKYSGDLCQILRISDSQDVARVKLIPRLDIFNTHKDTDPSGKRKNPNALANRPPQRFFNRKDIDMAPSSVRGAVIKKRGYFYYNNEAFKDGFLEKDVKVSALLMTNVNPTLDEITKFASAFENEEDKSKLFATLAEPLLNQNKTNENLKVGDTVEILEGNMNTIIGRLTKIEGDVVTVQPLVGEIQAIAVPISKVRKHYKIGDHVRVTSGKYNGETGTVVKVGERVITLITDSNTSEIQVLTKDLQDSHGARFVSQKDTKYGVHDLLQIDAQNVGIVIKIDNDAYQVMDQNGQIKPIPLNLARAAQIRKVIAVDSKGNPLKPGDQVRSIHKDNRHGTIIHINKNMAFIKSREKTDNASISVEKVNFLLSQAAQPNQGSGMMAQKDRDGFAVPTMRPNAGNYRGRGNGGYSGRGGRGRRRNPLLDKTVNIRSGPYKGYIGIVKEITESTARVELHTNSRVVEVNKDIIEIPGDPDSRFGSSFASSTAMSNTWNQTKAASNVKGGENDTNWGQGKWKPSSVNEYNPKSQYSNTNSDWSRKPARSESRVYNNWSGENVGTPQNNHGQYDSNPMSNYGQMSYSRNNPDPLNSDWASAGTPASATPSYAGASPYVPRGYSRDQERSYSQASSYAPRSSRYEPRNEYNGAYSSRIDSEYKPDYTPKRTDSYGKGRDDSKSSSNQGSYWDKANQKDIQPSSSWNEKKKELWDPDSRSGEKRDTSSWNDRRETSNNLSPSYAAVTDAATTVGTPWNDTVKENQDDWNTQKDSRNSNKEKELRKDTTSWEDDYSNKNKDLQSDKDENNKASKYGWNDSEAIQKEKERVSEWDTPSNDTTKSNYKDSWNDSSSWENNRSSNKDKWNLNYSEEDREVSHFEDMHITRPNENQDKEAEPEFAVPNRIPSTHWSKESEIESGAPLHLPQAGFLDAPTPGGADPPTPVFLPGTPGGIASTPGNNMMSNLAPLSQNNSTPGNWSTLSNLAPLTQNNSPPTEHND